MANPDEELSMSKRVEYYRRLNILDDDFFTKENPLLNPTPQDEEPEEMHQEGLSMAQRLRYFRRLGFDPTVNNRRVPPRRFLPADGNNEDPPEFSITDLDTTAPENFRIRYLRHLSKAGIWVPHMYRPPKHQTVIIFDWDDTLLCTTYLN
eukprot:Platyproteum_vivax@DN7439_c0_g1_i9.p1